MSRQPSTTELYARLAFTRHGRTDDKTLPDTELSLADVTADRTRLAEYARVCGFPVGDELPATYPHILTFPLSLRLLADPGFPFSAMGLVHIRNEIEVRRPLNAAESFDFRARLDRLAPHRRGSQFDVEVRAEIDGELAWSSRSSYLYKEKRGGVPEPGSSPTSADSDSDSAASTVAGRWRVPADIGRRYAAVSGDPNPIHLHPLTARLFGAPRPIAHGMWLKARCLAAFQGRLPEAYVVRTTFVKPVSLPSTVEFAISRPDPERTDFELRTPEADRTYLSGSLRPL